MLFALHVSDTTIALEWRVQMLKYLAYHVNEDSRVEMRLGSEITVFATALITYIFLRINLAKHHEKIADVSVVGRTARVSRVM